MLEPILQYLQDMNMEVNCAVSSRQRKVGKDGNNRKKMWISRI